MNSKLKYLSRNVLLFSISGFLPKIISFLLIPFYTSILSTQDYGIADFIATTVALMMPIFTCDIQDAVIRFVFDTRFRHRDVLSVAIGVITKGAVVVLLLAIGLCCLQIPGIEPVYIVFALLQYLIGSVQNAVSYYCRGIDRVKTITISSLLTSFSAAFLNVLLLYFIPMGLIGFLLAGTLSSLIGLIYMCIAIQVWQHVTLHPAQGLQKEMLMFSYPLIVNVIAWWVSNAANRYIIIWMLGITASGLYAVSYKIPTILVAFQSVLFQAWSISAVKDFDRDDKDGFISKMYSLMNIGMVLGCSFIIILNVPLARILYSADFFQAWFYVPPLLLSVVFNSVSYFAGSIYTAVKDTKTVARTTIIGAGVNLAGNFLLIPLMGIYGAAFATMVGYGVIMVLRLWHLRPHIHLHINWYREGVGYLLLLAQTVSAALLPNPILQCGCFLLLVIVYRREVSLLVHKCVVRIR